METTNNKNIKFRFLNWVNKDQSIKNIKILLIYLIIVFIVGIATKIMASSYATFNYQWLVGKSNDSANSVISIKSQIADLQSQINSGNTDPALSAQLAGLKSGLQKTIDGGLEYSSGADDQSIGMYIGWSMIALKLWIYLTTFFVLKKELSGEKQLSKNFYKFMFVRFITLFIGLSAGEALTIYFTMRNDTSMGFWTVFSFFSPALSIAFALGALPFIYKVINVK